MAEFQTKIVINPKQSTSTISPNLFGLSIEHTGRAVYDGIWIEEGSYYSKASGLRTELVDSLKRLKSGVLRWPGGCFSNIYLWEDGIGSKKSRNRKTNPWSNREECNQFGTDEFINLCEKIGADPVINLNLATGSVREALNWLEYCNGKGKSHYSSNRTQLGNPRPFGVRFWGIGNQVWGCGGFLKPSHYAQEYLRYASYLKQCDPSIECIASGHPEDEWNIAFLENLQDHIALVDYISLPTRFWSDAFGGGSEPSTDEEYFAMFTYLPELESLLTRTIEVVQTAAPSDKKIGITLDSWGIQHPEAILEGGMEQTSTMRDALMAGCVLHLFQRFSDNLAMATLANPVNALHSLINTKKETMVRTPTYYVFKLLQEHIGKQYMETRVSSPRVKSRGVSGKCSLPLIDASSTLDPTTNTITLTLINLHPERMAEAKIYIKGKFRIESGMAECLAADSPNDQNTFDTPHRVEPQKTQIDKIDNPAIQILPPCSITRMHFQII